MTMPTDMPRCETCRHWQSGDVNGSGLPSFGFCGGIPDGWDEDLPASSKARTVAPEPGSRLMTFGTFGCTAHEPKEG